jgi:hypothetical protein
MLPLYQLLMVSDNDDVKFALMRLRKYSTQSSMIAIPIVKKYYFFSFFHTSNLHGGCLSRVSHVSLKIKRP